MQIVGRKSLERSKTTSDIYSKKSRFKNENFIETAFFRISLAFKTEENECCFFSCILVPSVVTIFASSFQRSEILLLKAGR
jgi:hypothetical protein